MKHALLGRKQSAKISTKIHLFDNCNNKIVHCNCNPAGIYLLKVSSRNTRARCEICSKLTIKISERRQWCRSGIVIVNFKHISHLALVFVLLTLNM